MLFFFARHSVVVLVFLQRRVSILCWNSDPTACCGAVTGLVIS
jgi:hypothetical protein